MPDYGGMRARETRTNDAKSSPLALKIDSDLGLQAFEAWLLACRRLIDLWRTGVREQQDALLDNLRKLSSTPKQ